MVAPAAAAQPSRPPASIEDFLWNIHRVLAQSGPLEIDQLKDTYSKQLGHKCAIERFLVVGEGGLAATLRRIPHIVSLSTDNGATYVKAFQKTDITKEQLIEADAVYRRELIKKNAAAKAKAQVGVKAVAAAPPKAQGPPPAEKATRPLEGQADAGAPDAKKPRTEGGNDAETLAKMLIQGVVRVLQMRLKAGKGALPLSELEEEFKALWKVPFNLQQAGETDAVTFMQKWPHKVEVVDEGGTQMVQLSKKGQEKAKSPAPAKVAAVAKNGPAPTPSIPKRAGGPTRPPASIEDFLWNIHTVVDAFGGPMPIDQLKDAYSKHLGHKCAIERFLVVGEGGLAATLKRIPHIVSVVQEKDGATVLKAALPAGTTKEALIAADQQYRRQLQAKNQAAKEAAAKAKQSPPAGAAPAKQPPAAGAAPAKPPPAAPAIPAKAAAPPAAADGASSASTAATTASAAAAAAASPATAVKPPPAAAPATVAGQKRPEAPAGGETESAKKARTEEVDTLSRMLVQGVVRVLQNRQKEGKGSLPLANLEEEFKALWKVPFNLQQAGESDTVTFLKKWPNKVEIVTENGQTAVQLAKKAGEKAKAAPPAAATPAAAPAGAPGASAPTAVPPVKAAAPVASKAAPPAPPLEAAADVPAAVSANSTPGAAAPASVVTPAASAVAAGRAAAASVPKEAAATPASAPPRQAPAAADRSDGAAQVTVPAEAKPLEVPASLPELREQAADVLQTMRELLRRQEALVAGLQRLSAA